MIRTFIRYLLVPLALVVLCGCMSNARYVDLNQTGGVVAIPTNTNVWPSFNRKNAEKLIAERCPHGYEIESEQEVVVGTNTVVHTDTKRTGDPILAALKIAPVNEVSTQSTSQRDRTEWRIRFRRTDTEREPTPSAALPQPDGKE